MLCKPEVGVMQMKVWFGPTNFGMSLIFFCRIFVNYIHVVCMFSSADSISKQSSQNINNIQIWLQILRKLLYLLKSLCPNKPRFIHVFFASGILYLYIQWFRIIETMIARMNLFLRTSAMNCVAKM